MALAACGGDDSADTGAAPDRDTTTRGDGRFPVTVDAPGGPLTIDRRPERIVSLSPTSTEMLFAIGAGEQVVAVDDQSDHPPEAPVTDLSGYEPNVEAIAGYEPDLLVMDNDGIADEVATLGIPLLVQPAAVTLDDTYEQIEQLGLATGHADEAADVVEGIRADIQEIVDSVPAGAEPLRFYHELDDTYFTATSATFIGSLYELVGLENIADAADDGSGYPQLSPEYVVEADPEIVFLADTECCGQSAETVRARDGWSSITAVREGNVVELSDDIASRWGPRVVDLLRDIADAAAKVRADA
jgi:iron complex transport system substrate-binding protein